MYRLYACSLLLLCLNLSYLASLALFSMPAVVGVLGVKGGLYCEWAFLLFPLSWLQQALYIETAGRLHTAFSLNPALKKSRP